jgi:hypothetical protein
MCLTAMELNFYEFKSVLLHEIRALGTFSLGTISALTYRQRKTKKTCVQLACLMTVEMYTDF